MWTRSELEASKNSSREVTMPLPPPSYLVFSILFASTKLSLLKWQQRPEAEGIISRLSLHLGHNLPGPLKELFSVDFHESRFWKKTERTCIVKGPLGKTWTSLSQERAGVSLPISIALSKRSFLVQHLKTAPSRFWRGWMWVAVRSHFTKFGNVPTSLQVLL